MALPFEFAIAGPPVSQQARRRDRVREWTQSVRKIARSCWGEEPPSIGAIAIRITYFFDSVDLVVDNIPKPILDALNGLAFIDDSQIVDLVCRKRDLNENLSSQISSPVMDRYFRNGGAFLHILVEDARGREVEF